MQLILRDLDLPLRHPFTIAHGTTTVQHSLLVELRLEGLSGYGEGAGGKFYTATPASMRQTLEAARSRIESETVDPPEAMWERLLPVLGHDRFALCALDQAAHDLWGKRRGQPVYRLWGLQLDRLPLSNYTLGIDSVDRMVAKLKEFDGWPIYKIKLGTPDDLAIVRELRRHTTATFRVDANGAWSVDETLRNARALKPLGVEFIEQPLPPGDWDGSRRVFAESVLPVMADESCQVEEDVARCVGHFHGVNVKLVKAGGMTPARRMILHARDLGLKTMVGCMTESSVGISAIAQLLPLLEFVDMDGAVLIARDIATGIRLDHGRPVFPNAPGNGVRLL
ncbi:MAG: dipeptide epimerase [Verrucomicrobia bacterium]|nr:dipeptide epimerase [Verrucomicrobiota bacterium]